MSTADEVLLDAIMTRHGYTRAEAEEAARYVEHAKHVRLLLDVEPLRFPVYGPTPRDRAMLAAWEALDHRNGHAAIGVCFDAGLMQPFRSAPEWGPSPVVELTRAQHFARIVPNIRGDARRYREADETALEFFYGTANPLARQEAADTDAPVPPPGHETSHPPR